MRYGANEHLLIDKEAMGGDSPALDEKPDTDAYLDYFVQAFTTISRSQDEHGRISLTNILAYMDVYEVEDRKDFVTMMYAMNDELVDYIQEQVKSQRKQ